MFQAKGTVCTEIQARKLGISCFASKLCNKSAFVD